MKSQMTKHQAGSDNRTQEFITLLEADIQVKEMSINTLQEECIQKDRAITKLKNAVITLGVLFIGLGIFVLIRWGA